MVPTMQLASGLPAQTLHNHRSVPSRASASRRQAFVSSSQPQLKQRLATVRIRRRRAGGTQAASASLVGPAASTVRKAGEIVRTLSTSCSNSPVALLALQTTAVMAVSLAAQRLVRRMGVERMLQPEGHEMEDRFVESLSRAGLEPLPLAAQSVHGILTHPIRTWIQATGNIAALALVAQFLSSNGTLLLNNPTHALEAAQALLFTVWRLVSVVCCAWTVMIWEKEAFSRLARRDPHDAQALGAASSLVRRATAGAAVLLSLDTVGISLKALLAFGGVGGLAIGLASQAVASNFVAGASLIAARIFREGDKIEVVGRGAVGFVERFGVANTQLRLEDGSPYYIPNSELAKSAIRNLSRLSHRRILASFRLPYDDLPKVRALTARMEEYLRSRTDVDDTDRLPTRVVLGEVDDYSLVLSVQAFLPAPGVRLVEFERAKSEILQDLGNIIAGAGIRLEYPTRRLSSQIPAELPPPGMVAAGGPAAWGDAAAGAASLAATSIM